MNDVFINVKIRLLTYQSYHTIQFTETKDNSLVISHCSYRRFNKREEKPRIFPRVD